jgi:hypothetical protein
VSAALAALAPLRVSAQQAGKVRVLAYVIAAGAASDPAAAKPGSGPMRSSLRLRELGWEEGRNLVIERHSAEGRLERAREIFPTSPRAKSI